MKVEATANVLGETKAASLGSVPELVKGRLVPRSALFAGTVALASALGSSPGASPGNSYGKPPGIGKQSLRETVPTTRSDRINRRGLARSRAESARLDPKRQRGSSPEPILLVNSSATLRTPKCSRENPTLLENRVVSMHPQPIGHVPEDTARIAKAAFPKGNVYIEMRNVLGTIYDDEDFAELFEVRGRPAIAPPWRLAMVAVMQFSEGLWDRQAAKLGGAVLSMGYLPRPIQQHFAEQNLSDFSLDFRTRGRLQRGRRERLGSWGSGKYSGICLSSGSVGF